MSYLSQPPVGFGYRRRCHSAMNSALSNRVQGTRRLLGIRSVIALGNGIFRPVLGSRISGYRFSFPRIRATTPVFAASAAPSLPLLAARLDGPPPVVAYAKTWLVAKVTTLLAVATAVARARTAIRLTATAPNVAFPRAAGGNRWHEMAAKTKSRVNPAAISASLGGPNKGVRM